MFPLRDLNPSQRTPWITWGLILLNVLAYVYMVVQPEWAQRQIMISYALVPSRITSMFSSGIDGFTIATVFTSMFMHGGLLHIAGNMWFLFIFGDNVEDNMGHGRYLVFYLLSGIAAAATQVAIDPFSDLPMVGASGAIAGVLAAYLILYPRARVLTLVFLFIFVRLVELPAFVLIALWFVLQFFSGVMALGAPTGGGVAYWAHIGGFGAGMLLTLLFRRKRPPAPPQIPPWEHAADWR